ncbi:MAG: DUF1877 family protein [Myxococcales bacterium]|nr:MAG: DUF1877 family protein [Myxococcales bacterium]
MATLWKFVSASKDVMKGLVAVASSRDEEGPWQDDPRWLELLGRADEILFLGEEWHTLHVLLTGQRWGGHAPLGQALLGRPLLGRVVLDEEALAGWPAYANEELADLEVVPAGKLTPEQVPAVAAALRAVDGPALVAGFDPKALRERGVFPWKDFLADRKKRPRADKQAPGVWHDAVAGVAIAEPELPAFLVSRLAALTAFYERSAQASRGVFQCPFGAGGG